MNVIYRGKNISLVIKKTSVFGKLRGLMFRSASTDNLLFEFAEETKTPFHSFFVFFPFLMLWLDEKNRVIEWRLIRPFSTVIRPKKSFKKVVEIPLNTRNWKIIEIFVGKGKI